MSDTIDLNFKSDNVDFVISNTDILEFVYKESIESLASYAIKVNLESYNGFNKFIRGDGFTDDFFELRISQNIESENRVRQISSNWKRLELLKAKQTPLSEFMEYEFSGLCRGNVLNRHIKNDGVWGNARVSDVITTLARDISLTPDVDETLGRFDLSTANRKTGNFIKSVLSPLAIAEANTDWNFWVQDGRILKFKKVVSYNRSPLTMTDALGVTSNQVVQLYETRFTKIATDKTRLQGVGRAVDSLTDTIEDATTESIDTEFSYLRNSKPRNVVRHNHYQLNTRIKNRNTSMQTRLANQKLLDNAYTEKARHLFQLVARIDFNPQITPGVIYPVVIKRNENEFSSASGLWLLHTVKHRIHHGYPETFVKLIKRWELV